VAQPDVANDREIWKPGTGQDPARYLVNPGTVKGPGQHSAGALRHARPYIASGRKIFLFPVGVEGFTRSGNALIGMHHYIGDNRTDGVTINYEEAHIELNGVLPGTTSVDAMNECIDVLISKPPDPGLVLYAPGVFTREQYVLAETWNFTHDPEDRTHSIAYTISFLRTGVGKKVTDQPGKPSPPNPTVTTKPRGKPSQIFTVRDGAQTLRAISKIVYGSQDEWQKLVNLNAGQLATWQRSFAENKLYGLPTYQLPTFRFPLGTKFRY
jgi:hypothetical protein